MGKFLNTGFIDTVEVFMIVTGTRKIDFKFVEYAGFISKEKKIYGSEKGLPRHHYMKDYLVQDFLDFSKWIIKRYKTEIQNTQHPDANRERSKPGIKKRVITTKNVIPF